MMRPAEDCAYGEMNYSLRGTIKSWSGEGNVSTSRSVVASNPPFFESVLCSTKQELHVLWRELIHSDLVIVDSPIDHVSFLLLQQHHSRFDRVFDAETSNNARSSLSNPVASVCTLPFGGRIPPPVKRLATRDLRVERPGDIRIDDEDPGGLRQVKGHTSSLEGDKENLNVDIVHEMLDGLLALSR